MNRRILLLLTDLKIGGTPTVVRELAWRLHRPPEVEIAVACLDREGPVGEQIRGRGIAVTPLDAGGAWDVGVFIRLARLIRQQRFDTVMSFLVHANAAAAAASMGCGGVRFIQSIQTTQPRPAWHWTVQRAAQLAAEKIVVPSPSVAEVAYAWAGVPREKIVVIANGVELPPPPSALSTQHSALSPDPHANPLPDYRARGQEGQALRRIVFVGRLDPVKRLPDLMDAVAALNGGVHLHVYGEGDQRAELEKKIQTLGLGSFITLHGAISGPAEALAGAEILVLPSEAEGFGLVLIEAMAAGVAVVATDAPGIRDVVRHEETGILVPVGAPAALAAGIRRVLEDQVLRQRLIANGFTEVRRRFTWEAVIGEYRRLLEI